jgi:hypothetical protein
MTGVEQMNVEEARAGAGGRGRGRGSSGGWLPCVRYYTKGRSYVPEAEGFDCWGARARDLAWSRTDSNALLAQLAELRQDNQEVSLTLGRHRWRGARLRGLIIVRGGAEPVLLDTFLPCTLLVRLLQALVSAPCCLSRERRRCCRYGGLQGSFSPPQYTFWDG